MNVPGSPSSPLIAISRGPGSPSTARHLRPVGKPAPPRPRKDASSSDFKQILLCQFAGAQPFQQRVTPACDIGIVIDIVRQMRVGVAALRRGENALRIGVIDEMMADLGCRRSIAAPNAGRAHNPHPGTGGALQFVQQFFGAEHGAGQ